jgi:hypothetical protein
VPDLTAAIQAMQWAIALSSSRPKQILGTHKIEKSAKIMGRI